MIRKGYIRLGGMIREGYARLGGLIRDGYVGLGGMIREASVSHGACRGDAMLGGEGEGLEEQGQGDRGRERMALAGGAVSLDALARQGHRPVRDGGGWEGLRRRSCVDARAPL